LAVVPTLIVLAGAVSCLIRLLRNPTPEWLMAIGLAAGLLLAIVFMSLKVPSVAQVKSFYALCGLVPLAAFGARGLELLARYRPLRVLISACIALWAANSYASLWIRPSTASVCFAQVGTFLKQHRTADAVSALRLLLRSEPENTTARSMLVSLLASQGLSDELSAEGKLLEAKNPSDPEAQLVLSTICESEERLPEAVVHAREVVRLAPGNPSGYEKLAILLAKQGHYDEAGSVATEGLRTNAFRGRLRFCLGLADLAAGRADDADRQLKLAFGLEPDIPQAAQILVKCLEGTGRHRAQ
jgi:Flp pilus assembly protein TadD